ncbi:hypothetical protein PV08_01018 [Exophiala spinifera]|uniref:Uncharacterized protein n=1 Tax=Exophiala spinifera TaxID=91928 RepID=A0A0D2BND5_9EURO|nr:uncharacterized protein PV08_01018 [Exophiala spinifera]KIW20443.1 hypothetical protein PV08_01018 [Exophiala spinifera]
MDGRPITKIHRSDLLNFTFPPSSRRERKGITLPSSREENKIVRCDECKTITGSSPTGRPSIRLYKSRVQVRPDSRQGQDWQKYPAEVFLGAQLLSLIESSVSRKIVVHQSTGEDPTSSQQQGILVWVFNPDIYYSSSRRGPTAHRAMKIFYKDLPDPEKFLDDHSNTHEELVVPEDDYKEFKNALAESTDILPEAAQTFQDWTIGLLDRWEKHASGSARMDENPLNKKVEDGFELFKLPAGMAELYL